jgi:hypothetical protein
MLSQGHPKRQCKEEEAPQSLAQVSAKQKEMALVEVNKFKNKYKYAHQILAEEIPAQYSLSNINGVDLSGKVRE